MEDFHATGLALSMVRLRLLQPGLLDATLGHRHAMQDPDLFCLAESCLIEFLTSMEGT